MARRAIGAGHCQTSGDSSGAAVMGSDARRWAEQQHRASDTDTDTETEAKKPEPNQRDQHRSNEILNHDCEHQGHGWYNLNVFVCVLLLYCLITFWIQKRLYLRSRG